MCVRARACCLACILALVYVVTKYSTYLNHTPKQTRDSHIKALTSRGDHATDTWATIMKMKYRKMHVLHIPRKLGKCIQYSRYQCILGNITTKPNGQTPEEQNK